MDGQTDVDAILPNWSPYVVAILQSQSGWERPYNTKAQVGQSIYWVESALLNDIFCIELTKSLSQLLG